MRVLVTGGSGVVGSSTITALLQRGHAVTLLSRHADRDVRGWPHGVTPVTADVSDPDSIVGSADGCDAVVHIAGIVEENPPDATFERVNVEGTRCVVREAERAGVRRFVYVSSLGADRGASPYHRSKRTAEEIVRGFSGAVVVLRPGAVYGPGDAHVSVLLRLVRTLPVVPVVGDGSQPFQPIWHEDAAEAIAAAVEREDISGRSFDLAGPDVTSTRKLIDLLRELTDRSPVVAPVPELLASLGLRAAGMLGVDAGVSESQLQMLVEAFVIPGDAPNALTDVFGVQPTPLRVGLRRLLDVQPEQPLSSGIGRLRAKRYWVDIRGASMGPNELFALIRARFGQLMPSIVEAEAEPGTASTIEPGVTLTLSLPARGHVQVRVDELDLPSRRFSLVTIAGHPLAGAVRFAVSEHGDAIRFEVQVYDRPATVADFVAMRAFGDALQSIAWRQLLENVMRASGGAAEVRHTSESLGEAEARDVERWAEEIVLARRRDESGV
jgi:uncharacterized protein YbjT (DUF2867 family)